MASFVEEGNHLLRVGITGGNVSCQRQSLLACSRPFLQATSYSSFSTQAHDLRERLRQLAQIPIHPEVA